MVAAAGGAGGYCRDGDGDNSGEYCFAQYLDQELELQHLGALETALFSFWFADSEREFRCQVGPADSE